MERTHGRILLIVALSTVGCAGHRSSKGLTAEQAVEVFQDQSVESEARKLQDKLVTQCMKRQGFEYESWRMNVGILANPGAGLSEREKAEKFGTFLAWQVLIGVDPNDPVAKQWKQRSQYDRLTDSERSKFDAALGSATPTAANGAFSPGDSFVKDGCRPQSWKKVLQKYPNLNERSAAANRMIIARMKAAETSAIRQHDAETVRCLRSQGFRGNTIQDISESALQDVISKAQESRSQLDIDTALAADRKVALQILDCSRSDREALLQKVAVRIYENDD